MGWFKIKRSKKLMLIAFIFISIILVGCSRIGSGNGVEQLNRDKDTEYDEGSKINESTLSKEETRDLAKLSKVWGVVKYYHPKAISGEINMDYELFRVMPSILEEDEDVNLILYEWVESLGEIEKDDKPEDIVEEDLIQLSPPTQWAEDVDYLGEKLSSKLTGILKTNNTEGKNAYVNFKDEDIYASMGNEEVYSTMDPEDTGYRLLGLFRYWNVIEYYYPYKDIMEEDWDVVLEEFIPKFIDGTDQKSYILTIAELTTRIHDTHASVIDGDGNNVSSYFGEYWLPASFVEIDKEIVINKTADGVELKNGDILLSIEGKDVKEIVEDKRKYQSQSREDIVTSSYLDIFRRSEEDVDVSLVRDGKPLQLNVETRRQAISGDVETKTQKMEDGEIYYINAGQLKAGEISKIMKKAQDTDGLILDMRNYPTSFIPYELAEYLIPTETEFVKASIPNPAVPGQFYFMDPLVSGRTEETKDSVLNNFYKGKVVILMDEQTISQGEFTIMSIRNTKDSVVLGRESAGADGNVLSFMLPGNVTTTITGVGIYYPDESPTQRIGIQPDIYMEPTIEGLKEDRDEYLEGAIEIIKED